MTRVFRVAVATTLLAIVTSGASATTSSGYGPPLVRVITVDGIVLAAERNSRTLYVHTGRGGYPCTGACSLDWPPFLISPDDFPTDGLVIVHRPDGRRQWSLGDRPLHFFIGDAARGDANGDGIGRWRALRPAGSVHAPDGGRARNGLAEPSL